MVNKTYLLYYFFSVRYRRVIEYLDDACFTVGGLSVAKASFLLKDLMP